MNRQKIVAGNWKMNLLAADARALYSALANVQVPSGVKVIVAPPAIYLSEFSQIETQGVALSAQNCSSEEKGAFTGEYSVAMLKSIGLQYVIIGHSERRALFHEDDALVGDKVRMAVSNGVTPIFCCGELLEERENNEQEMVVANQLRAGVFNLTVAELKNVVIAYEPVWAIGTGKTAASEEAQEMHRFIRSLIASRYGEDVAAGIPILYGGSVKPGNAKEIFSQPDVDGGLIGGAALKLADFQAIIDSI